MGKFLDKEGLKSLFCRQFCKRFNHHLRASSGFQAFFAEIFACQVLQRSRGTSLQLRYLYPLWTITRQDRDEAARGWDAVRGVIRRMAGSLVELRRNGEPLQPPLERSAPKVDAQKAIIQRLNQTKLDRVGVLLHERAS